MTAQTAEQEDVNGPTPDLKRVMGPKLLLLFIVGDILGAGVYAVTGSMAGVVGGIVWLPFLVAFVVATLTALSYLELVTKYPQAAGAALYTHKAFGVHFITFIVAFAVICSGITSASTSSNVLAPNLMGGLRGQRLDRRGRRAPGPSPLIALGFMVLLALINLRGVGESVKFNVVLTLVEVTALTIVIGVGFYVIAQGDGSFDRITTFENPEDKGLFLAVTAATSIAFFAMVGFEDSVNMVEETKEPERIFPRTLLTGLGHRGHHLHARRGLGGHGAHLRADRQRRRRPGPARGRPGRLARLPDRQGVPVPGHVRGRQHRADQHADGQPPALRPRPPGRAARARWARSRPTPGRRTPASSSRRCWRSA